MQGLGNATVGLVAKRQTLPSKFADEKLKKGLGGAGSFPKAGTFLALSGPGTVHKYSSPWLDNRGLVGKYQTKSVEKIGNGTWAFPNGD